MRKHATKWRVPLEVCYEYSAGKRAQCSLGTVSQSRSPGNLKGGKYQRNPDVNSLIIQEPMHKCPWWGHHIWIFLHTLPGDFLCAQLRTCVSRRFFAQTRGVRRGNEFGRLFENEGFGGGRGALFRGCALLGGMADGGLRR
jgi:hypothetical protein